MIVNACISEEMSTTGVVKGCGRLQVSLGAGGTRKYFFIDSIVTTLSQICFFFLTVIRVPMACV